MKRIVFLSLSIFALLLITQIEVFACGCAGRDDDIRKAVTKDFNQASVVFSGRVIAKEFVPINKQDSSTRGIGVPETLIYKFAVDGWWKGKPKDEIILDTSQIRNPSGSGSGSGCEFQFEFGKKYLVYADGSNNKLIASRCRGTRRIENSEKDIQELQKLKAVKKKSLLR